MLVHFLLFLLTTVSCEAQQTRLILEKNVYKRGINHSERAEFLYWHNYYRRQVENPNSADMIYLLYHKELETAALDWAAKCNFHHGNFNFTRHQLDPKINIGQNIAVRMGGYSIQNSVFRWFDEHSDYSYKTKSCKPGAKCGHYEQVAGAVVTHIGCAVVYCHSYSNSQIVKGHAYNTVCNYYPSALRANWYMKNGKAEREKLSIYEEGSPCTACPDGRKVCEDKLCRSSPSCLTLDNQCKNPDNTTTCLCDASFYPVYDESGLSMSSSSFIPQSSPKQTTVLVIESLKTTSADLPPSTKSTKTATAQVTASTIVDLPRSNKSTETAITQVLSEVTSAKTSTFDSTSSQSLQSQTTSQNIYETVTKISKVRSTEAEKQISRTQSTRAETETHEKTNEDDTAGPKTTASESRQHEITTSKPVVPEITTKPSSPHFTTMAAATSSGHFGDVGDITTASQESFSREEMQPMCFIKMSTRYLTQNDMLPKDPFLIGDESFQRRWKQIQRQPKHSAQVMKIIDSRAFALPSFTMQCHNFIVSAVACLVIRAHSSI